MPRKKREESPTGVYHWIVRGMNKKYLFHDQEDFKRFLDLIAEYRQEFLIQIYHYCLMSNHAHLLLHVEEFEQLSQFSHYVQRRYAYYYCAKYKWTGSVFQRGYRSMVIDRDAYLLECARYIERNPVKAKLAEKPEEYLYTSYHYYGLGRADELLTASPSYLGLSNDAKTRQNIYAEYINQERIQEEMIERGLLPV